MSVDSDVTKGELATEIFEDKAPLIKILKVEGGEREIYEKIAGANTPGCTGENLIVNECESVSNVRCGSFAEEIAPKVGEARLI